MLNIVPRFIQQRLNSGERCGTFHGSCVFVDIAGFTAITGELMVRRKEGAERLSRLLNRVYRPILDRIRSAGGFVPVFAGDSVTGILPDPVSTNAVSTAGSISEHFLRYPSRYSGLRIRTGVAAGSISWTVRGKEGTSAYLFHGDPVAGSAEVVRNVSPGGIGILGEVQDVRIEPERLFNERIKRHVALMFFPPAVVDSRRTGEFRDAASVFVAFCQGQGMEVDRFLEEVPEMAARYGGYWNGAFHDDKGLHALVSFGAPVSMENDRERALRFADAVLSRYGNLVKAGLSAGTVYAGNVGTSARCTYTVLGDRVNEAARLMESAEFGMMKVSQELTCETGKSHGSALLGRENELEVLFDWAKPLLQGGNAGIGHVRGPAGMGKSALVEKFLEKLPGGISGYVMQTDQILRRSLNPFSSLLGEYFGESSSRTGRNFPQAWERFLEVLSEKDPEVCSELRRTRSFIESLLGLSPTDPLHDSIDARGRFENTLLAIRAFIRGLCAFSPVVLVVEDLHWLDTDSETLLGMLGRTMKDRPLLILTTSRPGEGGEYPSIAELDDVRSIHLEPLPTVLEKELASTLLEDDPSDELVAFIAERAEGNPFFTRQFCLFLRENDLVERRNGLLYPGSSSVDIPGEINSVIVSRIDRLTSRLRETVQTASVLGREFTVSVLSRMLTNWSGTMDHLLRQGVSEDIWNRMDELRYIFRHAILRDAAYRMQLTGRLRRLHLMAARAILSVFGEDRTRAAETAYHFEKAGRKSKAAEYLEKAADFARDEYRNREALDLYRRLRAIAGTPRQEIETDVNIANILIETGSRNDARKLIEDSLARAFKKRDPYLIAHCSKNLAKLLHRQGLNDEAVGHIQKAHSVFTQLEETFQIASTQNILGNINTVLGKYDEALENFRLSSAAAERSGDDITIALNVSNVGNIHLYRYELDQAEECYRKAMELCRKAGEKKGLANAIANTAVVRYERKDYAGSMKLLKRFVELAKEIGNREGLTYIYGNIGILYQQMNDFDSAYSYHQRQMTMAEDLGDLYNTAKAIHQMGHMKWLQGEYREASEMMLKAIELNERTGDLRGTTQTLRDLGAVYLYWGRYRTALDTFQRAIDLGRDGSDIDACATSLLYIADIHRRMSNPEKAAGSALEAVSAYREMREEHSLLRTLIEASEILMDSGEEHRALELLREAEPFLEKDESTRSYRCSFRLLELLLSGNHREIESLILEPDCSDETAAEACYRLHAFSGTERHRYEAIRRFKELHGKRPRALYRERLTALGEPISEG